jgi:ElaB/YqjD/DUF883 family membrane-anchored ribosome-binding protein
MSETSNLREDAQKDPDALEREIDQTRARMNQTLGAIERRLTPGQIVDEAVGLFREHGGDFAANLGSSIKENPVPAMLAAVGIGWMILAPNRLSRPTSAYGHYADYDPNDEGTLGDMGESIKGKMADAGERMRSGAVAARDRLTESWTTSKDAVRDRMSQTASTAQAQANRAREGFNTLLEEQPIILAAVGLAVGAAIGAMLPSTEPEDRLLGPARDKTISQIKERGAEVYEQVREKAENAVEKVQQAAQNTMAEAGNAMKDREESNPPRGVTT